MDGLECCKGETRAVRYVTWCAGLTASVSCVRVGLEQSCDARLRLAVS